MPDDEHAHEQLPAEVKYKNSLAERAAEADDDQFERLKAEVPDFHGYDEEALETYRTLSFYFAQRVAGLALPVAATITCENWGHDAPRGLCQRCGLGVELGSESEKKQRERVEQRQAWLASRR
jgi:hypothetical protein